MIMARSYQDTYLGKILGRSWQDYRILSCEHKSWQDFSKFLPRSYQDCLLFDRAKILSQSCMILEDLVKIPTRSCKWFLSRSCHNLAIIVVTILPWSWKIFSRSWHDCAKILSKFNEDPAIILPWSCQYSTMILPRYRDAAIILPRSYENLTKIL